jgi:hypothetical protein
MRKKERKKRPEWILIPHLLDGALGLLHHLVQFLGPGVEHILDEGEVLLPERHRSV